MGRRSGFTLTELLIVVAILGILASMALPQYWRIVERSYRQTAQDVLFTIYSGERSYFFARNTYCSPTSGVPPTCTWREIHMDDPNTTSIAVDFTVPAATAATVRARAERRTDRCATRRFLEINEQRDVSGNWPPSGSCPP